MDDDIYDKSKSESAALWAEFREKVAQFRADLETTPPEKCGPVIRTHIAFLRMQADVYDLLGYPLTVQTLRDYCEDVELELVLAEKRWGNERPS